MSIADRLLGTVQLPRMVNIRQHFEVRQETDVAATLSAQIAAPHIAGRIRPGARVAIGAGSRGIAELPLLVRTTAAAIKARGAVPFVVPAMGSHGGATAEGQAAVLAHLGVTEASVGCPIVATMEVVEIGRAANGIPVEIDAEAMRADGIVVINRVKPHTSFTGPYESGLVKMIVIGLGKQKGANAAHSLGFGRMAEHLIEMGRIKLENAPFLFGIATIENAYDRIGRVVVVPAEEIFATEDKLLAEAKAAMPRILFNPIDALIVDQVGKEYSGTGADPNITGKAGTPFVHPDQKTTTMAILDLSEQSGGNAAGMGLAEFCTRRLLDKVNFEHVYANHLTSTALEGAKIPIVMDSDEMAVKGAVFTCNAPDLSCPRLVRLRNTLTLGHIQISEALLEEARQNPSVEVLGAPFDWRFTADGSLADLNEF